MSKCVVYEAETSTMFQRCGGCGGRNSNFPYRKLFTPDLNNFLYTKVTIPSFTSFTSGKGGIRKYGICASQMIHLDCVNDIFRHQKQYVYKFLSSKYCIIILIFHLNILRIVRKQGECFAYCRK